jgi:hypothetical protein
MTRALVSAMLGSRMVRDLVARLAAYGVALVLVAIAFGFLVATLHLALIKVVEPPLAALLTSLVLGLLAGLIVISVRLRRRGRVTRGALEVDTLLLSVTDQVRRDPWSAIVIAAVIGALTEITRSSSSRQPPT